MSFIILSFIDTHCLGILTIILCLLSAQFTVHTLSSGNDKSAKQFYQICAIVTQMAAVGLTIRATTSRTRTIMNHDCHCFCFYGIGLVLLVTIPSVPIAFSYMYTARQNLTTELLTLVINFCMTAVIGVVFICGKSVQKCSSSALLGSDSGAKPPQHSSRSRFLLSSFPSLLNLRTQAVMAIVVILFVVSVSLSNSINNQQQYQHQQDRQEQERHPRLSYFKGLWGVTYQHCLRDVLNNDETKLPFPWITLLPRRALNFFTGSETCPTTSSSLSSLSFSSRFYVNDDAQIVVEVSSCSSHNSLQIVTAGYMAEMTPTILWEGMGKKDDSQKFVIPFGIESVDVVCGSAKPRRHIFFNQQHEEKRHENKNNNNKNILVLVLDAVSRPWFMRAMPHTLAALESSPPDLRESVFQFLGLGLNGHSTTNNISPMLLGYEADEFYKTPQQHIPHLLASTGHHRYLVVGAAQDYVKSYFHGRKNGGGGGGGDGWTNSTIYRNFYSPEYTEQEGNFNGPYSILRRCISDTYVHTHMFNYLRSMWNIEVQKRKQNVFATAIFSEAHEGTQSVLPLMDKELAEFIFDIREKDNNTVIVLMADHGHHMGPYFEWSKAGRLEHLMPTFFLILPNTMKSLSLTKQLRAHEQTMLSMYDVYLTLAHIVDYPQNTTLLTRARRVFDVGLKFDSLLRMPIEAAANRNCASLKIPKEYCLTEFCRKLGGH
eukprot:PhM_4_TR7982/c0_g3_i1/m.29792